MASSNDSAPPSNLREPYRYITENRDDGKAFFSQDLSPPLAVVNDLGGALMRLGYVTGRPPVDLNNNIDVKSYAASLSSPPPLVPPGGGPVVWYIDTPPDSASPMHRTVSLDLVIQLEGEIELTLSGGETRLLKPGDMTVQRSTAHMWRNPSLTKWTRMLGVMFECQPVVVDGKTLGAEFPHH
ncbi:hypothetical protein QBC46DRAFT_401783 [Diplogelasinospora grovesii]|uniref:Uncharacterized protein n=1 Tax=Diplogelasinospora grovesii TaxID=303347 RepID=A0AAN6RXK3_9PEZI|nr:hypothetical protein QBC46DRAFT_401783 [Diplogelasinospora grovesii]